MIGCQLCQRSHMISKSTYLYTNNSVKRLFNPSLQRYCSNIQTLSLCNSSPNRWSTTSSSSSLQSRCIHWTNGIWSYSLEARIARTFHWSTYGTCTRSYVPVTRNINGSIYAILALPRVPITRNARNFYGSTYAARTLPRIPITGCISAIRGCNVVNMTYWRCSFICQTVMVTKRRASSSNGGGEGGGREEDHKTVLLYLISAGILVGGLSYAAVPLYRLFCQASGYGSAQQEIDFGSKIEEMERVEERVLTIRFEAGTSKTLRWKFKPQQKEVRVAPGETALAFYKAENLTDEPIIGIATYNVIPFEAGQYFNKIQCFCFEEQQLNPNEEVDMPVFFYIDPEFTEDPKLAKYDELILSYTFFQSNEASAPVSSPHAVK